MGNSIKLEQIVEVFLNGPASPPPDGVVVNLENPHNSNGFALAIAILCVCITSGVALVRAYSRIFIVKRLRIEDYLGLCALVPFAGVIWYFLNYRRKLGFFVHQWNLHGHVIIDLAVNVFVLTISYGLIMILLKTAILIEWMRIFIPTGTRNIFFWASTVLISLNIALYLSSILVAICGCQPIEKEWHFWIEGSCIDQRQSFTLNASFNLIIDVFILILPQATIFSLQMNRRQKIGVMVVFSIGLLTVAIASGRLYSTVTLDFMTNITQTQPVDTTYQLSSLLMWGLSEVVCVFLVFCMPCLPKVFSELGIVSKLTTSWRSWRSLPDNSSSSKQANTTSWPGTIGSPTRASRKASRVYRFADGGHQTDGSLTELTVMQDKYTEHEGGEDGLVSDTSILKTVEIDRSDDTASKISADPVLERQHPWTGH